MLCFIKTATVFINTLQHTWHVQLFQHTLHLVPTLNHTALLQNLLLLQSSLKFSFVKNATPDMTNLATVSVSLFPILGVEYDIASYTNTTMPGLVSLKGRYILTLFRQFSNSYTQFILKST